MLTGRSRWGWTARIVVPALLLAACSSSSGSGSRTNPSSPGSRTASDVGVTADTITIGTHIPLTGPAATSGEVLRPAFEAYVKYVNATGGINGRNLVLDIVDNAYEAAKTLSAVRKLVEQDKVFAITYGYGTAPAKAAFDYLTQQKVPDMNLYSGVTDFTEPPQKYHFAFTPTYTQEGRFLGSYIKSTYPGAKIAVLYQNDDFGKAYEGAMKQVLGSSVVAEQTYETTDVDVMSQVTAMAKTNADVAMCVCIFKPVAQLIKESHDMGWQPHMLSIQGVVNSTLVQNVGKDLAEGVLSDAYFPAAESDDPKVLKMKSILSQYGSKDAVFNGNALTGMVSLELMVDMLKAAGLNPTRDSLLKAATTKTYEGTWYGKVSMSDKNHVALTCLRMKKIEDSQEVAFGDTSCAS